jgi:hypothetical protein
MPPGLGGPLTRHREGMALRTMPATSPGACYRIAIAQLHNAGMTTTRLGVTPTCSSIAFMIS